MKYVFLFTFLFTVPQYVNAQPKRSLFATYSISTPEPFYHKQLNSGRSYRPLTSHSFGLRYIVKGGKAIALETGLELARLHFRTLRFPIESQVHIINVPVYANITFLEYLFVNGGLLFDAEIKGENAFFDRQTGIGFGLGPGARYSYRNISVFVNPSAERHGFIPLTRKRYEEVRQSLFNPGVKMGIGYSF